jgi:hypothetical protein
VLLIFIGAVIATLISIKRIADRVSLIRERRWEERIETENLKRSRIWSEHLERKKVREMKSE